MISTIINILFCNAAAPIPILPDLYGGLLKLIAFCYSQTACKTRVSYLICITSTCEHAMEIVIKFLSFNTSGFTYTDNCQYSYPWEVIQLQKGHVAYICIPQCIILEIPDHSFNDRIFMTLAECYSGSSCEIFAWWDIH